MIVFSCIGLAEAAGAETRGVGATRAAAPGGAGGVARAGSASAGRPAGRGRGPPQGLPGLLGQVGSYGIDSIVADQARKVGDCLDPGQVWYSLVGGSMAELQQQWRGAAAGSDGPMIWTLLAFLRRPRW